MIEQILNTVAALEVAASTVNVLRATAPDSEPYNQFNQRAVDAVQNLQVATAKLELYEFSAAAEAARGYVTLVMGQWVETDHKPSDKQIQDARELARSCLVSARKTAEKSKHAATHVCSSPNSVHVSNR